MQKENGHLSPLQEMEVWLMMNWVMPNQTISCSEIHEMILSLYQKERDSLKPGGRLAGRVSHRDRERMFEEAYPTHPTNALPESILRK